MRDDYEDEEDYEHKRKRRQIAKSLARQDDDENDDEDEEEQSDWQENFKGRLLNTMGEGLILVGGFLGLNAYASVVGNDMNLPRGFGCLIQGFMAGCLIVSGVIMMMTHRIRESISENSKT